LAYRTRTKHFLDTNDRHDNSEYIPQLYIKIKGWNPPPAPLRTESQITNFVKIIKAAIQTSTTNDGNSSILHPHNYTHLQKGLYHTTIRQESRTCNHELQELYYMHPSRTHHDHKLPTAAKRLCITPD